MGIGGGSGLRPSPFGRENNQANFRLPYCAGLRASFVSTDTKRGSPSPPNYGKTKSGTQGPCLCFGGGGEIRTPAPGLPRLTI